MEACQANGVTFQPGEVVDVGVKNGTASVTCQDGSVLTARWALCMAFVGTSLHL